MGESCYFLDFGDVSALRVNTPRTCDRMPKPLYSTFPSGASALAVEVGLGARCSEADPGEMRGEARGEARGEKLTERH